MDAAEAAKPLTALAEEPTAVARAAARAAALERAVSARSWSCLVRWVLNRLFEWQMAFALFGLGVWLILWPRAIDESSFRLIREVFAPEYLVFVYLAVGWGRIMALVANGHWKVWGPPIRAIGAFVGALIWFAMDYALWRLVPEVGTPPSPGLVLYTLLGVGELVAIILVAADDRTRVR